MSNDPYLRELSNRKWVDLRYQFARGSRVRILSGPYLGRIGTVDSCVFLQGEEGVPGYHVALEDGSWVMVRWDMVEGVT
ncbi:MAG: hypothetical protein V3U26_04220 [Dehalococcoidia bacterium]